MASNNTSCPDVGGQGPPINYNLAEGIVIVMVLVVIMIVTVAGNLLVVLSVVMFRQMRTITNRFILSLACADMLVGTCVMPVGAYNLYTNLIWEMGQTMCLVTICLDVMLTTNSILHLSCLALDRYIAICSPFFYQKLMKKSTSLLLILACWTLPALISWLPIMNGWNALLIEGELECRIPPDGKACVFLVNIPYAIICSLVAFYAPTVFMIGTNLRIYREARRQAKRIRSLESAGQKARGSRQMRAETKAAKTLSIIMGVFCTCWCPFFLLNVIDPIIGYRVPFTAWQLALWLGYVNSTINPFLYYSFNRGFRRAITRLLLCVTCRGNKGMGDTIVTVLSHSSDDHYT